MTGAALAGWGVALPAGRLTNADLEARLDTSDEWIVERTGIRERRIAAPDERKIEKVQKMQRISVQERPDQDTRRFQAARAGARILIRLDEVQQALFGYHADT